jgi:prepilin-type N-terminal cleavage/methylation domain-containing protein
MRIKEYSAQSVSRHGFTLVEILVVVSIVGLLATIAVCNFMVARDSSRLHTIRHNLGTIEAAKEQWAFDNRKAEGADVGDVTVLSSYFSGGHVCQVVNETYVPNPIGTSAEAALPAGVTLGPYPAGSSIPAP